MSKRKKDFRLWFRKEYGLYYVSFPDTPGKWISTGTGEKTEAIAYAKQCKPEFFEDKMTFNEFTRDFYLKGKCKWLRRMNSKGRTFSDHHIAKMRGLLENYLQPEFRNIYLHNITRRMIDDYLIDLKSKKSGHSRPLAAYTKNMLITVSKKHLPGSP